MKITNRSIVLTIYLRMLLSTVGAAQFRRDKEILVIGYHRKIANL